MRICFCCRLRIFCNSRRGWRTANVHINVEYFEVDVLLISFYAVLFEGVAFGAFVLLFVFF